MKILTENLAERANNNLDLFLMIDNPLDHAKPVIMTPYLQLLVILILSPETLIQILLTIILEGLGKNQLSYLFKETES